MLINKIRKDYKTSGRV